MKSNFLLFYLLPLAAFAERNVGIGGVASSLMGPTDLATKFLHAGCFVMGSAFLFASIVKYIEHRRSPTMIPISTVFFLVIAGLALIAIPIFTK